MTAHELLVFATGACAGAIGVMVLLACLHVFERRSACRIPPAAGVLAEDQP